MVPRIFSRVPINVLLNMVEITSISLIRVNLKYQSDCRGSQKEKLKKKPVINQITISSPDIIERLSINKNTAIRCRLPPLVG